MRAGLFRRVDKARKRIARLWKRGRVDRGLAYIDGRPEILWIAGHLPQAKWQHDAEVAEVITTILPDDFNRLNVEYDADFEMWIGDARYLGELDRGTMRPSEIAARMRRYEGCQCDVLWVCPTTARIEALQALSAYSEVEFWFCVYRELLEDPRSRVLTDKLGHESALGSADTRHPRV